MLNIKRYFVEILSTYIDKHSLVVLQAYPGRVYKSSALIELYAYISKYSTEVRLLFT